MPKRLPAILLTALSAAALALSIAWGQAADSEFRTWRDISGTYEVEAKLIAVEDAVAHLELSDSGKVVKVPLKKLSNADRLRALDWKKKAVQNASADETNDTATDEVASATTGGAWPTWRGPERDGISRETGLLKSWPEGGPPLAWQIEGIGTGFASVSVADGKIFTMGRENGRDNIYALDEKTGRKLWTAAVGAGRRERGPNGTPTVDGDRVYGISIEGDLLCANADTGTEIWRRSFSSDFGGKMMSGWGYSESPLIDGDKIICSPGGRDVSLVALDKETAKPVWKCKVPAGDFNPRYGNDSEAGYSSAIVVEFQGVRQYVQFTSTTLAGVAAADGELLWRYDRAVNTHRIPCSLPIYHDGMVFGSTAYDAGGGAVKLSKSEDGGVTAEEVYFSPEMKNHHGGMILVNGVLYGAAGGNRGGFLVSLDFKTGDVLWRERDAPKGSLTFADGRLYLRTERGELILIEPNREEFVERGRFEQPDRTREPAWTHPVIANGKLYIRDQDLLLCYDVKAE